MTDIEKLMQVAALAWRCVELNDDLTARQAAARAALPDVEALIAATKSLAN